VANSRIIICVNCPEKDDNIMFGLMGNVNVPEEHDDIVIDVAFRIDATEEADGVVDGLAFGHNDVASKLHSVFLGARGRCGENKC
jgi:hypothetical protein